MTAGILSVMVSLVATRRIIVWEIWTPDGVKRRWELGLVGGV